MTRHLIVFFIAEARLLVLLPLRSQAGRCQTHILSKMIHSMDPTLAKGYLTLTMEMEFLDLTQPMECLTLTMVMEFLDHTLAIEFLTLTMEMDLLVAPTQALEWLILTLEMASLVLTLVQEPLSHIPVMGFLMAMDFPMLNDCLVLILSM